jgi:hypothetical protein
VTPREHPAICSFLTGEPSLCGTFKPFSEVCTKQSPAGRTLSGRFPNIQNEEAVAPLGGATSCISFAAHGARRSYYQSRVPHGSAAGSTAHGYTQYLVMCELHGCLSQGVSVCRLSDHPLVFDGGLMEHSRRGSMLLRVRMTARVTIRWGVHRLYEIAITALTSWMLLCSSKMLRAFEII